MSSPRNPCYTLKRNVGALAIHGLWAATLPVSRGPEFAESTQLCDLEPSSVVAVIEPWAIKLDRAAEHIGELRRSIG